MKVAPEDQKILELFYSGLEANDRLAFEIIKNKKTSNFSFFEVLVCVVITTGSKEFAMEVLRYLEVQLSTKQFDFLKKCIESTYQHSVHLRSLINVFTREESTEITYVSCKRTGKDFEQFLIYGKGNDERRKSLFKAFLEKEKNVMPFFIPSIPGLTEEEIEIFIKEVYEINQSSGIQRLRIENIKSERLPDLLFTKKFAEVNVVNTFTKDKFPKYIFHFKGLKKLSVYIDENTIIPDDWSAISELTELTFYGAGHVFENFNYVEHLPKLKKIVMGGHRVKHPGVLIFKRAIPIKQYIQFIDTTGYSLTSTGEIFHLPQDKSLNIASALERSILPFEIAEHFFRKIISVNKLKNLPEFSLNELLILMNVNNTDLRSVLQTQINTLSEKQKSIKSLNEKSLLYIAGTPSRKKTEIKQKLKELNISLAAKPDQAITHLLIGNGPKEYKTLQDRDFLVISEQQLYGKFKKDAPGFIEETVQQGDTQISGNILQFLYNDELANVRIGIEMLKNGGVPDELIDPLLVVFKTCPDTKLRGEAKQLLLRHASVDLLPLINDAQRFTNLHKKVKAQEINKKLEKIAQSTSRNLAAKLSLLLHGRFKKGLRYILYHFHEPCIERSLAHKEMMEGTHFNFAAGLGFTDHREKSPDSIWLTKMRTPAKFPIDVVNDVKLIESANFHNCKLRSLPRNIGDMKDLKKIDLSYNFLASIPKSIEALDKLEVLDLKANTFKSFPSALKSLSNLKILDIRFNMVDGVLTEVKIPDDVKVALSECEILV